MNNDADADDDHPTSCSLSGRPLLFGCLRNYPPASSSGDGDVGGGGGDAAADAVDDGDQLNLSFHRLL